MQIAGKRIVILGGTGGFGYATAQAAAQAGAEVVVVSPSPEKVDAAVKALGGAARGQVVNVTDEAALERFFDALGSFDHLVTTMGDQLHKKPFLESTVAHSKTEFEVRFWGQYNAARLAAPRIAKTGSMTLTSAASSQRAIPNGILAGALNSAVEGMVRQLAAELGPVRVNAVAPGFIATARYAAMPEGARKQFYDERAAMLPLRRIGDPQDVAEAFLYLMSNSFSTGTTLFVDGGMVVA